MLHLTFRLPLGIGNVSLIVPHKHTSVSHVWFRLLGVVVHAPANSARVKRPKTYVLFFLSFFFFLNQ